MAMSYEPSDLAHDDVSVEEDEEDGAVEDLAPLGRSRAFRWTIAIVACLVVLALVLSVLPLGLEPFR
jgi:hypothetical protein